MADFETFLFGKAFIFSEVYFQKQEHVCVPVFYLYKIWFYRKNVVILWCKMKNIRKMNPVLIYPSNSEGAKIINDVAEYSGAKIVKFPKEYIDIIGDYLFAKSIEEGMESPEVPEEEIFKILKRCK